MTLSQNFTLSLKTEPTCPFRAKICHGSRFPAANRKRRFSSGTGTRPVPARGLAYLSEKQFPQLLARQPEHPPSRVRGHRAPRSPATSSSRGSRDHAPRGAGRAGPGPGRRRFSCPPHSPTAGGARRTSARPRDPSPQSPAALQAQAGGSRYPARVHVDRVKCPSTVLRVRGAPRGGL